MLLMHKFLLTSYLCIHKSIQRVQQVVIIKSSLQFNLFLILIREGLEGEIIIQSDLFLIWGFGGRNQA